MLRTMLALAAAAALLTVAEAVSKYPAGKLKDGVEAPPQAINPKTGEHMSGGYNNEMNLPAMTKEELKEMDTIMDRVNELEIAQDKLDDIIKDVVAKQQRHAHNTLKKIEATSGSKNVDHDGEVSASVLKDAFSEKIDVLSDGFNDRFKELLVGSDFVDSIEKVMVLVVKKLMMKKETTRLFSHFKMKDLRKMKMKFQERERAISKSAVSRAMSEFFFEVSEELNYVPEKHSGVEVIKELNILADGLSGLATQVKQVIQVENILKKKKGAIGDLLGIDMSFSSYYYILTLEIILGFVAVFLVNRNASRSRGGSHPY